MKHVPVLHSPAVDLIKQLHENKGSENHGAVLCWSTYTGLVITISHIQKIRKYKHQHKHDGQLIDGVKNHIFEHCTRYQRLISTIRLVCEDVI